MPNSNGKLTALTLDKEIFKQQRQKRLENLYIDRGVLALDPGVQLKDYKYNSQEQRFQLSLEAKSMKALGEFKDNHTAIRVHCLTCHHEWVDTPINIIKKNCSKCEVWVNNAQADHDLWHRSEAIIQDKQGKIITFSDYDPDIRVTVDDSFVVECQREHRFTTSHRYLRRDRWCPVCKRNPLYKDNLISKHVYDKKQVILDKQRKLNAVCNNKGVTMKSVRQENGTYLLACNICRRKSYKTSYQILNNIFLCKKKCVRGEKFSYKSPIY